MCVCVCVSVCVCVCECVCVCVCTYNFTAILGIILHTLHIKILQYYIQTMVNILHFLCLT